MVNDILKMLLISIMLPMIISTNTEILSYFMKNMPKNLY